jgi:exopolysaccharide production protein ExoQ
MTSQTALFLCLMYILWLFARDVKRRATVSHALWIPLLWVAILGSRPISFWFGHGGGMEAENPVDRMIFLALILAGLAVVLTRRTDFQSFSANNRWLFLLCVFWGFSVIWADDPFVALKRWIKDLGNVVMVLVILSEKDPITAIKAVLARCVYLLVPFSVLCIKWYGSFGRGYNSITGEAGYQGVTTGKNLLGITLTVCTVFLVWEILQMREHKSGATTKIDLLNSFLLLIMAGWLFKMANSATSLACTIFGACSLVALRLPFLARRSEYLIAYALVAALLLGVVSLVFDLGAQGAAMLGRDSSLHGRTEIWTMALDEKSNPLVGAGFYSFWTEARVAKFRQVYSFSLTQAHNGYLETYLNGGLIGLGLLLAMIISAGRNIQKRLAVNPDWGGVSFVFWLIVVIHNWSEASFNKLSLLWFVLLLVSIEYPRLGRAQVVEEANPAEDAFASSPCLADVFAVKHSG